MASSIQNNVHVLSRVWIKTSNLRWIGGTVEGVQDRDLVIRCEDGQTMTLPRGSDKLSQRTPANLEAVDNLTSLPDLDEPNMLHSLCVRYMQDKIYTRTGPILVCMNPWRDLQLYSQDILKGYRKKKLDHMPPHVFGIAEASFSNLQTERKDQTILVSGDSGSGKTESTKFMMQYLASVAHHTSETANTETRVLQCNPVLEAFGNAKTLRNDNSSRFGKYIDIFFDESFALAGAKIDTYLLEKSRVVSQEQGERNFHIFYQITAPNSGISPQMASILKLAPPEQFNYIAKGANVSVGYKPANSFQHTVGALQQIGIHEEERNEIFKVLGAVLHAGNIKVGMDKEQNAVLQATDSNTALAASLLGVDCQAMVEAMTIRHIKAGSVSSGDSYTVTQTQQAAVDSRDALARALYGNMFDVLVERINLSLGREKKGKTRNISILDIFGFEHFKTNHFEQFCINYANEKLQGHFNEFNFSLEIQEYQRENVQWSYDDFYFQTNTRAIELIEGKRTGMLALLDEQCIMPNGSDETYCTKLKNEIPSHPHLYTAKMRGMKFTLKHYAAEVVYDADGFCFKNKDPVQPAIVELMSKSCSTYVQQLFKTHWQQMQEQPNNGKTPGKRGAGSSLIFESVTAQFKRQLVDLMVRINAAEPHFVRCINPNSQKAAHKMEPEMILDQLRCSGLMEAVRVSRAGFPIRMLHQDFIGRFSILIPVPAGGDSQSQAGRMCQGLRIPQEHYRMGKTKVFMRREINDKLEEERSKLLVKQALLLQKVVRGHTARKYVKWLRVMRQKAAAGIQRMVRRMLVRRWYLDMLNKRRILMEQQARAQGGGAPGNSAGPSPAPGSALLNTQPPPNVSAPPPPVTPQPAVPSMPLNRQGSAGFIKSSPPHLNAKIIPGTQSPQVQARVIEELELNLGSVRELYYNERASQLALSNLVREIHALQEPDEILKRIKQLEDKIATQRRESVANKRQGAQYEEEGLGRRTDSLTACMAILEEKMHLIQQSQRMPSRADYAQIRSEVESEVLGKLQMEQRANHDLRMQLEAAVTELRRRDEMGGGGGFEDIQAMKQQMMDDRGMLESIIRTERKQREEEFHDMDANVTARDARIMELEAQLADAHARLGGAPAQPQGSALGGDVQRMVLDLKQQCSQLQADKSALEARLGSIGGGGVGGGIGLDAGDTERFEQIGRQLATVAQSANAVSASHDAAQILQQHAQQCQEQQRMLAGRGDTSKLSALSAQRRMLEACKSVILKASGIGGGGASSGAGDGYNHGGGGGGGGGAYYQQQQGGGVLQGGGRDDMVLM